MTQLAPHSPERFARFIDLLTATAERTPEIIGFVGMGSTAQRERADEWSDHDFALVTVEGAQDRFRYDLDWLPASESIALSVVEHHGGVKVIYEDGHVLEFGIASIDGLVRDWNANADAFEVFYDAGGVAEAFAIVAAKPLPTGAPDNAGDVRLVLTQLLIGTGRARRGELLSANTTIRAEAATYLLSVLGRRLPGDRRHLDALDSRRRFELAHPEVAARIADAVRLAPEDAARTLLDLTEELLEPGWADFPRAGVAAVRRRLGWQ